VVPKIAHATDVHRKITAMALIRLIIGMYPSRIPFLGKNRPITSLCQVLYIIKLNDHRNLLPASAKPGDLPGIT
jgi:hypothetical protein